MNFIKQVLSTIVNLAIGPLLNLRKVRTNTVTENVINVVGVAARGVVVASYFTAVPALLVKASLVWIFGAFVLAGILLALSLLGFLSFMGYAIAAGKSEEAKEVAEAVTAAATATPAAA